MTIADQRDQAISGDFTATAISDGVPFGDPSQALFSGSGSLSHDARPIHLL
jgi:hypothetical protein